MATTYSVKFRKRRAKKPFFVDRPVINQVTGSGIIGLARQDVVTANVTINTPPIDTEAESTSNVVQVTKNVRLFGEANIITFDEFRYGKDVKITKHLLNDKLSPNIALSDEGINDGDDEFSNFIGSYDFGQSKEFKTVTADFNLIPFRDMNGKLQPINFLTKDQALIQGFPYVYNTKENYSQFIDSRDREYFNGVIDVFHTHLRNSEITDIQLRGAKVLLGLGDFNTTQNNTFDKKGSALGSDVFETKETQHDFFQDAQEIIMQLTGSAAQVGYTSEGNFKLSPFSEHDTFINEYTQLSNSQKNILLMSSSKDDFSIGVRFKSKQNGFIMTPFYSLNQKRSFGKDSIAFSGLLKG